MTIERDIHRTFRGPVYLPGDGAYKTARATWHGALEQRPAVVAEALCAADVQDNLLRADVVTYRGGATVGADAPVGHRDAAFNVTVAGADEPLAAQATGGSFLNFLHDTACTETADTPADYAQLRAIKAAYDPDDVFGFGHNSAPAGAMAKAASVQGC